MIDFCYTDRCYRAYILNYFGDRKSERLCGTCGNCRPTSTAPLRAAPVDSAPRALTDDELLRVRKILACAKRMNGRFGRKMLISTLRGSTAKQLLTARLNELSTYGLLRDMANDELEAYIDALIETRCLRVKPGAYPTISTTELGDRVMREQEQISLSLKSV
jgi:ATP-dependent DNA helicase RecQ